MPRRRPARPTIILASSLLAAIPAHAAPTHSCAIVAEAPDGFIELKLAPGRHHETIMRLLPGETLWVDDARCTRAPGEETCDAERAWRHIVSVPRLDDREAKRAAEPIFTDGWAEAWHLEPAECEE